MIFRFMFTGYADGEPQLKMNDKYRNVSLSAYQDKRFLYYESDDAVAEPEVIADSNMKKSPNGHLWVRMMDIFHYSKPLSDAFWKRKNADRKPSLKIAYLYPHLVSSYIYYHYQFQEEVPRRMNNKFAAIYIHENCIVMYGEEPAESDKDNYPGVLTTSDHPKENWSQLMGTHFMPWDDFDGYFRLMKLEKFTCSND